MATKIQLRRDTASDWTSANPTLAAGEFGYESDTTKFKIGDGSTAWNSLAYKTGEGIKVVADDSATITVAEAGTLYVQGGSNVTTSTDSAGVLTINATGEVTGSSTTTFTNKTFDAEGTGNSLSNVDVANLKSGVLDTDISSVSGSDDTLASAKAIKTYVDAQGGGVSLSGSTNNTVATVTGSNALAGEANLTFDGSTLAVTGAATVSTTLGVTGASTLDGVTITDNHISSNRSNDNIVIEANGTGQVELGVPFDGIRTNTRYDYGVNKAYVNHSYDGATRIIANSEGLRATATQTTSSTNFQLMAENRTALEMAGFSLTSSNETRGLRAKNYNCVVGNDNSSSAATIGVVNPINANTSLFTSNGNITATNVKNYRATLEGEPTSGKTATFTTSYNYWGKGPVDVGEGGTTAGTNYYGLYIDTGSVATNNYGVWINDDAYTNKLGGVTLQNGGIATEAVSITDNKVATNRSNDNLELDGNGTGQVHVGDALNTAFTGSFGNILNFNGHRFFTDYGTVAHQNMTSSADRHRGHVLGATYQLTEGQSSSDSDNRFRNATMGATLDVNGGTSNPTSIYSGVQGGQSQTAIIQSSNTASELGQATGLQIGNYLYPSGANGAVTVNRAYASLAYNEVSTEGNSSAAGTITEAVGYRYHSDKYGSGTETITNDYAFYYKSSGATNSYAFYSEVPTATSRMGAIRLDNQSGDPTHGADFSWIYAKDDGSSSEVHVKDEAGNVTKISPHNKAGEWEYYSVNKRTGKTVRVNMERMIKKLEEYTGESFIETE